MRILGIDPGSQRTGIGIVELQANGQSRFVHCETIVLLGKGEFPERLALLCNELDRIITQWEPATVAIETVFLNKSVSSALKLGHARGAAMATVVRRQLPLAEYAPRLVKQSLVGKGSADKDQVAHMVRLLLGLTNEKIQADAADALAIALTHAHMQHTQLSTGVNYANWRRGKQ